MLDLTTRIAESTFNMAFTGEPLLVCSQVYGQQFTQERCTKSQNTPWWVVSSMAPSMPSPFTTDMSSENQQIIRTTKNMDKFTITNKLFKLKNLLDRYLPFNTVKTCFTTEIINLISILLLPFNINWDR